MNLWFEIISNDLKQRGLTLTCFNGTDRIAVRWSFYHKEYQIEFDKNNDNLISIRRTGYFMFIADPPILITADLADPNTDIEGVLKRICNILENGADI